MHTTTEQQQPASEAPGAERGAAPATGLGGRGWAYAGITLGAAVSVAANVAHSYVPPAGHPAGTPWTPEPGAVLGATFWPLALLTTSEILARTSWPAGWRWILLRAAGLTPVALVAAVVSYLHLHGLLLHYQESPITATIGPLSVDGLMVMATGALLATSRTRPADRVARSAPGSGTGRTAAVSAQADRDRPACASDVDPSVVEGIERSPRTDHPGTADSIHREPIDATAVGSVPIELAAPATSRTRSTRQRQPSAAPRSIEELHSAALAAIESGDLPPAPTAEAIRRHLQISPARARTLRDQLTPAANRTGPSTDQSPAAPTTGPDHHTADILHAIEEAQQDDRNPLADNGFHPLQETPTTT